MRVVIIAISIFGRAQRLVLLAVFRRRGRWFVFSLHKTYYYRRRVIFPSIRFCYLQLIWLPHLLFSTVDDASASCRLYFKNATCVNDNNIKCIENNVCKLKDDLLCKVMYLNPTYNTHIDSAPDRRPDWRVRGGRDVTPTTGQTRRISRRFASVM